VWINLLLFKEEPIQMKHSLSWETQRRGWVEGGGRVGGGEGEDHLPGCSARDRKGLDARGEERKEDGVLFVLKL